MRDLFIGSPVFGTFLIIGFFIIGLLIFTITNKKENKGNKKPAKREQTFAFIGVAIFLVGFIGYITILVHYNPIYWGYGKIDNVHHAIIHENKLLLHDVIVVSSKSRSTHYTRLQVVNSTTGERLYRTMLGKKLALKGIKNDTAWYLGADNLAIFDLHNYKILAQFDAGSLQKIPALQKGLLENYSEGMMQLQGNRLEVTTVDGYQYLLNPFTKETVPKPNPTLLKEKQKNLPALPKITITIDNGDGVSKEKFSSKDGDGISKEKFSFKDSENSSLRKMIVRDGIKSTPLNPLLTFINPAILHTDAHNKCIIVLHYEVVRPNPWQFTISAVDFAGKVLWNKNIQDFACYDMFSFWSKYEFQRSLIQENKLILTFGGFVYAFDIRSGEKIWENRF